MLPKLPPPPLQKAEAGLKEATFVLDNVTLTVHTPFLPVWVPNTDHLFITSEPDSSNQIATASAPSPFREFSIIAVPFGTTPPMEAVPISQPGGSAAYIAALRAGRKPYESEFESDGPTATLFGQKIVGQVSLLQLALTSVDGSKKPTLYVEWVVEAGPRLWIVRVVQEQSDKTTSIEATRPFLQSLNQLALYSSTLDQPITLTGKPGVPASQAPSASKNDGTEASPTPADKGLPSSPSAAPTPPTVPNTSNTKPAPDTPNTLPFPPWWSGDCNVNNHPNSYELGGTYLHAPACGPRPLYCSNCEQSVYFGAGGLIQPQLWGALEWECVELLLRYMRLRFNINPYQADGFAVVDNYGDPNSMNNYNPGGPDLEKIINGGQPPAPQPGDILSYGGPPHGHTSLVKSVNVDSTGNGSITVVEQNNSERGQSVLPIQNWYVYGNAGAVTKWLVGDQHYQPAVARNQDGRLEVFARGRDNAVYHNWQTCPGCGWSGWQSLGGIIRGNPAVVRHQNGVLEVYVRGIYGDMYHTYQVCPNCGWVNWVQWTAPVKFQGSPTAIINGVGGAHVFGWGADNQLWYTWQQCTGCAWSAWTSLGGISTSNPTVGLDASNRVTVFVRGTDRAAYYRQQLSAGSDQWTGWTSLGGTLDSVPAVGRNSDGRLEIFALQTETTGTMYHNWQVSPNGGWSDWNPIVGFGYSWARGPVIGQNANGALEVYAVQGGSDPNYTNGLYRATQLNGYSDWSYIGGTWRVGNVAVGQNADGRLQLFGRGDDRLLYNAWQPYANSTSWNCCGSLGGEWP